MQLLMLSGNSLRNQDWIQEAQERLGDLFSSTYVQIYKHWGNGQSLIDLPAEVKILADRVSGLSGEYGVFAKSIGTVLAAQALELGVIRPRFLLFCGLPLGYIQNDYPQFADAIAGSGLPVTIVHNQHDPVGSSQAVADYMAAARASLSRYRFIETPGDTHEYQDYNLLRAELSALQA